MSNFYLPRTPVTPARMEPMTDSQLAQVDTNLRRLMMNLQDAQSIRDNRLHHEMFDLAERMAGLVRKARGL